MSSTLQALKAQSAAKVLEEKKAIDRKRELLVITIQFLLDQGFISSAEQLQQEAGISGTKLQVADNIDLVLVYQHFLEYYEMRFGRPPKVLRKVSNEESNSKRIATRGNPFSSGVSAKTISSGTNDFSKKARSLTRSDSERREDARQNGEEPESAIQISGKGMKNQREMEEDSSTPPEQRLLKPLSLFLDGSSSETRELALMISRDIFNENPNVRWEDVVGLEDAKQLLKEAMVIPAKYPELFEGGLLSPWKGVLLYGPPGTGKTMLAKAVATECNTTFFNISASTIVSKYRGDSEKLVRILFDLARYHAPSTIFLDEIDSIMGQRGGGGNEHEASRRMKTELLIQMDGLAKNSEGSRVFILAASNLPWELDSALLRRLEKRVLVNLPELSARKAVFQKMLPPDDPRTDAIDYDLLAEQTDGYSCADVCLVCKEAAMYPMRRLLQSVEEYERVQESLSRQSRKDRNLPKELAMGPVTNKDATSALENTRPSASADDLVSYVQWQADFGSS